MASENTHSSFLAPKGPAVEAGYIWAAYAPNSSEDDAPIGLFVDPAHAQLLAGAQEGRTVGRLDNPSAVLVPPVKG